jgi:lipopolysaccharide export system protein LptA
MFPRQILTAVLFISCNLAHALPADFQAPIDIEAEYVEIDSQDGLSIYRGNVKLTRGTLEIIADQVRIQQINDAGHVKATIIGQPARYTQKPNASAAPLVAAASEIVYMSSDDVIEMRGSANLTRDADVVTSDLIRYDMRRDLIIAGNDERDPNSNERVRITIQPTTVEQ